ncbi:MAG: PASTA domain-containing protein [Acidobacteria bacterium]|nr:PASTA domain-containing protein [Acidobacteriota bacterium]
MAFTSRVWSAGKLLLLAGALVATYLLSAAAAMRVALKAREVQVPNLVNRTANEASSVAADLGLAVKLDDVRRPDPKIAAGRVLAQDPPAGTVSREQRSIRLWLSSGPRSAVVPALTGETERTASMRLTQDGLEQASLSEIRSASFGADVIVAQDPAPTTPGTRVALLVNRAEQAVNYVMPDLIGVNGERAATLLRQRGFRVAVVASSPYPGVAAGIVLRQNPQAGFQIASGEPISLEVSR